MSNRAPATVASWDEFVSAGLLWWVNRSLHVFGWAIAREVEGLDTPEERTVRVFPVRVRYRGFDIETESNGFQKLTKHIRAHVDELIEDVERADADPS